MIPLKDDLPTGRVPVLTIALIAANALAFLWQLSIGLDASAFTAGAIPYEILTLQDVNQRDVVAPPLTIFTSMFMHGGFAHIGSNMLFLWIFGNNVEDALGRLRFLGFYLLAGVAAALTQTVAAAVSGDELATLVPMVGASGAIAGVLAAYIVLFPHARVLTLFVVFVFIRLQYLPAVFFIGFWFVMQVLAVVFGGSPGVAVFAHIGGFVTGFLLVRVIGRRARWRAGRVSW
ncbi:MAG TPA: rhomboid family intramembrane serine protease [Anaeromyxobacter sp.]